MPIINLLALHTFSFLRMPRRLIMTYFSNERTIFCLFCFQRCAYSHDLMVRSLRLHNEYRRYAKLTFCFSEQMLENFSINIIRTYLQTNLNLQDTTEELFYAKKTKQSIINKNYKTVS